MSSILWKRFETNAARHPDKAAFIFARYDKWQTVTYQQLLDKTRHFAHGLSACHVIPGMRAAVMTPPSVEFFALAFAMLKIGIVPIIVDPAIGLKKLSDCLKESQPHIFIGNTLTHALRVILGWGKTSIKHNLSIQQLLRIPILSETEGTTSRLPLTNLQSPISTTSPAAIIYTSGSTGLPKGVLYTHANFAAQLDLLQSTFDISQDEIDLPAFPLYALIDALLGVTSVIPDISFPVPGKTDPEKVLNAIRKFNVTNMFASPVLLDILEKFWNAGMSSHQQHTLSGNAGLQSLKRVITAGAPASVQLQERFRKLLNDGTDLFGIYGATEVLPIAKVESREIFEVGDRAAKGAGVYLGKPVNGIQVRIIRISDAPIEYWQDSLEVEPNVVGEITVQGAAVTRSYIARAEANLLSKIKHGDDIIHRMGDVGYFDEHGRLWYCGRKSHCVLTRDDVLFTEQIEGIFNAHPFVYRTALVGINREPVLWVELQKNADQEKIKRELMDFGKDHPQASKIKKFLFMKKFPTDVRHNSKIIREELTAIAERRLA